MIEKIPFVSAPGIELRVISSDSMLLKSKFKQSIIKFPLSVLKSFLIFAIPPIFFMYSIPYSKKGSDISIGTGNLPKFSTFLLSSTIQINFLLN